MAKAAGFNGETHIKSQNDQLKFAAGWKQRSQAARCLSPYPNR